MKSRRRWDRAAGAVLAVTGVFLLVFTVVGLAPAVSNLGSTDEHLAGDATMTLMIFGPMLAVVVLSTLGCAWLLWRGWRGAKALALVWIVGAGLFAAQDLAAVAIPGSPVSSPSRRSQAPFASRRNREKPARWPRTAGTGRGRALAPEAARQTRAARAAPREAAMRARRRWIAVGLGSSWHSASPGMPA